MDKTFKKTEMIKILKLIKINAKLIKTYIK